ncbi:MAG: hypothetical protein ACFFAN_15920, partial [Promethearchaeota archaeon]
TKKFIEFRSIKRKKGVTGKMSYANTGRIIRDDFFNWIIDTIIDFHERIELLKICEYINQNREITQYIIYLLINSNLTQLEIVDELKKLDLYISRETVRKIGLENLSEKDYNKKFKKSVKSYQYNKKFDLSQLEYNSLLNLELQQKFKQFYLKTGKYANDGRKIRREFINFLNNTVVDFEKRQFLFDLCNNINSNRDIEKFIIATILKEADYNTGRQLSLNQISDLLNQFGLNVHRMTVARIALQYVYNNNNKKFSERFPQGGQEDFRIIDINHLDYNNFLQLEDIFKEYHIKTNDYPNQGISITPYFMDWISKNIYNSKDRNDILLKCNSINYDSEILKLILDKIINTNLNISQIQDIIRSYGLDISRKTISLHAEQYLFKNDKEGYNQRFPMDFDKLKGNLVHTALRYLLTNFFDKYYENVKYYSEIMIFPPSMKKADGIILNIDSYNFLQKRFEDIKVKRYLNSKMNLTMLNTLSIHVIQCDFTNNTSEENLADKMEKYQNPYILLIIVDTKINNKNKIIPINFETTSNYIHNVRIIGYSIFSKFIGLRGIHRDIFNKIVKFNNSDNLEGLENIITQLADLKTYSTDDLRDDIGEQIFDDIFKDYKYNKEIFPRNDFTIFSSFIQYCLTANLLEKEITRGSDKGTYYIFTIEDLDGLGNNIVLDGLTLLYLNNLSKKFNKGDNIFYKNILLYNPILKKKVNKRVILIRKSFLDQLKSI